MNYLVVLSGVPGSGKSYFSNALREDKEKHVYIISSDQIRKDICGNQQDLSQDPLVWKIFYSLIKTYSEDKEGIVILDATNAKKEYRNDSPFGKKESTANLWKKSATTAWRPRRCCAIWTPRTATS